MLHQLGAKMAHEEEKEDLVSQDSYKTVKTIEPAEKVLTEIALNLVARPKAFKNFG